MDEPRLDQAGTSPAELREAAVSGVRWVAAARVGSDVVLFTTAIVLARLISPAEFGHAAVALIFVPLAAILAFEGFGSALVQRKEISPAHVQASVLLSVLFGIAMTALTFGGAELIGAPLFGETTAELIQLVSPVFLLAGIGTASRSLLWRDLDFRRIGLIEMLSLVFGTLAAVALAIAGLGAEAIIIGALVTAASAAAMLIVSAPPPAPRLHRQELREITRFGLPASLSGLSWVGFSNADYAILATQVSAGQVGIYWRAFQIGVVYQDKISGIMMRLAFPLYSRTRDLDQLRSLHERATRLHAATVVPLLAVLIVTAPDLVPWLFGDAWREAVVPAQILAGAGMIAAVLTGYSQVMLAAGRPRELLVFNVSLLAVYCGAVYATAGLGIQAVAIAVVGVHVLMLVSVYRLLLKRVLGLPMRRLVTDLLPAVAGSLVLVAAGLPVAELLRSLDAPAPVAIAGAAAAGITVYLVTLVNLFPSVWADISGLARRVLPSRPLLRRAPAVSSGTP